MDRPLIGQVLSRMGKLSAIDIDEILAEQAVTRQRFGEIAISWGLVDPQQLCDAWCSQLADGTSHIDLQSLGIDDSAVMCLSGEFARRIHVMPIRFVGDELVIATARLMDPGEAAQISAMSGREIRFVKADPQQIDQAIAAHYTRAA